MVIFSLEHKAYTGAVSASGVKKYKWEKVKDIHVALYKKSETKFTTSECYQQASHIGVTYSKGIRSNINRLVRNNTIYDITEVIPGRLKDTLIIKEVVLDGC